MQVFRCYLPPDPRASPGSQAPLQFVPLGQCNATQISLCRCALRLKGKTVPRAYRSLRTPTRIRIMTILRTTTMRSQLVGSRVSSWEHCRRTPAGSAERCADPLLLGKEGGRVKTGRISVCLCGVPLGTALPTVPWLSRVDPHAARCCHSRAFCCR